MPVPRAGGQGGDGGGDDDEWEPDLDDDGSEYGGPVKSFLEHMEVVSLLEGKLKYWE